MKPANESEQLLVSPLFFFLPVPMFMELWGAPKGTGIFRLLEEQTEVPIGISEKTLRKNFIDKPYLRRTSNFERKMHDWIYGGISLQMDILACAEVEWLSDNFADEPEESRYKSLIGQILPVPMDDESVTTPVEMYFKLVRNHFRYESWQEMAEHVPMDDYSIADIESKRRKLMGWVGGDHLPDPDVVGKFLELLILKRGEHDPIYYQLLYHIAAFMERLLQSFLPSIQKLGLTVEDVVAMFGTFHCHFERHKKAASLKTG